MGDLSEDQEKTLEAFKKYNKDKNLSDHPQYDDYYMLRFLRARKFDMDKSILMFTTFIEWRKENDVDNILNVGYTTTTTPIFHDQEITRILLIVFPI